MKEPTPPMDRLQSWRAEITWSRLGFRKHRSNVGFGESFFQQLKTYDLWLVTEGEALMESLDGTVSVLKRGSIVFIRPGYFRRLWQEKGKERLAIVFIHFMLFDLHSNKVVPFEATEGFPLVAESAAPDFSETLGMQILRIGLATKNDGKRAGAARRAVANQVLKALLFETLVPQRKNASRTFVSNVARHRQILGFAQSIAEKPQLFRSVAEMAQSLYISQEYFTRLFSELIGKSPMVALIESRLQKAKQYLTGSDLTIKQIAEEIGYRDAFFFSRQFKKNFGITPLQFRTSRGRKPGAPALKRS